MPWRCFLSYLYLYIPRKAPWILLKQSNFSTLSCKYTLELGTYRDWSKISSTSSTLLGYLHLVSLEPLRRPIVIIFAPTLKACWFILGHLCWHSSTHIVVYPDFPPLVARVLYNEIFNHNWYFLAMSLIRLQQPSTDFIGRVSKDRQVWAIKRIPGGFFYLIWTRSNLFRERLWKESLTCMAWSTTIPRSRDSGAGR